MRNHLLRSVFELTRRRHLHHKVAALTPPPSALPSHQLPTIDEIEHLSQWRKHNADLPLIRRTLEQIRSTDTTPIESARLHDVLNAELRRLPNATHPAVQDLAGQEEARILGHYGGPHRTELADGSQPREFAELCKRLNILRTEHLGHFTGPKSYYLLNELADLEQALVRFSVAELRASGAGFRLMSVPDIVPAAIIEGCGMSTTGERNQVYKLDATTTEDGGASSSCLSGTAEMALAGYFAGRRFDAAELPLRVMAASRCFRAETSGLQEERGIYRVHTFTKVEMFAVCRPDGGASDAMLEEFRATEMGMFEKLGVPFRLLDMPPVELGAPAYRKYDVEAWLPGRRMYGEISSCSNCTDYQARRLSMRLADEGFVHTVNGTACAVPRMLIAIVENYQVNIILIES